MSLVLAFLLMSYNVLAQHPGRPERANMVFEAEPGHDLARFTSFIDIRTWEGYKRCHGAIKWEKLLAPEGELQNFNDTRVNVTMFATSESRGGEKQIVLFRTVLRPYETKNFQEIKIINQKWMGKLMAKGIVRFSILMEVDGSTKDKRLHAGINDFFMPVPPEAFPGDTFSPNDRFFSGEIFIKDAWTAVSMLKVVDIGRVKPTRLR